MTKAKPRATLVDDVPRAPPLPRAIAAEVRAGARVRVIGHHVIVIGPKELRVVAGRKRTAWRGAFEDAVIAHDGTAVYAIADHALVRLDVATKRRTPLLGFAYPRRLALVAERYLFVGARDATYGLDLEAIERGIQFQLAAPVPDYDRAALGTILGDRVLWICAARDTLFATVDAGKLVRLGRVARMAIEDRDGAVFGLRDDDRWMRIQGLALPASAAPRRVSAWSLEPTTDATSYPAPDRAWTKRAKCTASFWRASPSGELVGYDGEHGRLVWFDRAGKRRAFEPPTMVRNFDRADDDRVAVVTSQQLTVFDSDGAQVLDKAIVKRPAELMGVAFVAGGQLVVLTTEEVRLVDAAGRTRHRVPLRQGRSVQPFREGTLVIVGTIATYGIEVFEVAGKQLVRRFRDRIAWQNNYPAGGRYLVHANTGHWFELLTA